MDEVVQRIIVAEQRVNGVPTGLVKYIAPGFEDETVETHEAAGLIRRHYENGKHVTTVLIERDNLRVAACLHMSAGSAP